MSAVLVTGGAGYIGSHVALALIDAGHEVIVIDNLSTGNRRLVPPQARLVVGEVGDTGLVRQVLSRHRIEAVIHLAASTSVAASVTEPLAFYRNNVVAGFGLIEACLAEGTVGLVFSSSAAVYGAATGGAVAEDDPTVPISPYGASKLAVEWILREVAAATSLRTLALRYFNVAGADPAGRSGQLSGAESLIKLAAEVAVGRRPRLVLHGVDYDTPDGTCIRDFVHVSDIASAHLAALDLLRREQRPAVVNVGYGHGFSVRQVIQAFDRVLGRPLPVVEAGRRPGDIPVSIADSRRLRALGWQPAHDDLDRIVATALAWERRLAELGDSD